MQNYETLGARIKVFEEEIQKRKEEREQARVQRN